MFKINPNPTFTAKVELSVPGSTRPAAIEVEFKHLPRKAIKAFFENLEGKSDADALSEIMIGWSGIDATYAKDTLEQLLDNYPAASMELFEAFRRELLEAKRKN